MLACKKYNTSTNKTLFLYGVTKHFKRGTFGKECFIQHFHLACCNSRASLVPSCLTLASRMGHLKLWRVSDTAILHFLHCPMSRVSTTYLYISFASITKANSIFIILDLDEQFNTSSIIVNAN